jgi:hypothetical protein
VALVLASFVLYSPDTPFPGVAALLPCVGAGLVIYANATGPTVTGFALSWQPLVGVGLISYSLYLWHWPLLVFGEQFFGRLLTKLETVSVVVLSLVAATASWKFVEQPFRRRIMGSSRPALFSIVGAFAAVVVVIATVGIAGRGLPQRLTAQALQYASGKTDRDTEISACKASLQRIQKGELCRLGSSKEGRVDFVVWGDSHADAIAPAFRALANETGASGWLISHPGCAPLLGVVRISRDAPGCDRFNVVVISTIEQYDVRTVFLVGRWEANALGPTSWESSEGLGKISLQDADSKEDSPAETRKAFERGLTRTLSRLERGLRSVVLVMDVPNTALDTPEFLAKSALRGGIGPEVRIDIAANGGRVDSVADLLSRLCKEWHAMTIDPRASLCTGSQCLVAMRGRSLYRDDHHLSVFGALQLVDLIRPSFEGALSAARSGHSVAALHTMPASSQWSPHS